MSRTSTPKLKAIETPKLKTIEEARKGLEERGESVAEFARRKGLKSRSVYGVLYGEKKGRRGDSHRAAVALGIKAGVA